MMQVYERCLLRCPYGHARSLIKEMIGWSTAPGFVSAMLVRLPPAPIWHERSVMLRVEYARGSDGTHFDEPWQLRWTAEPESRLPSFSGRLAVRAHADRAASMLELNGEYAPPALAGSFDIERGARAASLMGRVLLDCIGTYVTERATTASKA
jgi:hypothetical protein